MLLVFQAMEAAGKDGTIKHVMSRVNPQGVDVFSFKQPSDEELSHDFLWRYAVKVPQRGRIGIFNRSYYEEVLVVRVHQELLKAQKLPPKLVDKRIWDERLADIARFEDYPTRQGVVVLKFYLNLSREQQKKRFTGTSRQAGQELEVLRRGRARTPLLGQLHARLRGGDLRDGVEGCALVRGARGQQMVLPPCRRGGDCRGGGAAQPRISESRTGSKKGACRGPRRAYRGKVDGQRGSNAEAQPGKSNLEVADIGFRCMGLNSGSGHPLSKEDAIKLIKM